MSTLKNPFIGAAGALLLAASLNVGAQAYPDKPIKVVVPWPPSGIVDIAGRVIGEKVQAELGQTIIIENKPGAGGMIGADIVARSDPDGYTLLLTSTALNMNTALGRKMSVDVSKAFSTIRVVAWAPSILVAYPGLKLSSVNNLVSLAKSKPGELTYASAGNGSPAHFAAEMFRSEVGIDVVHVPYKGAPPAMNDQIAGRVTFHFANATVALPQIKAGKVTALAITAGKRSALVPNVPTMAEAGYPDFKASQWLGYFAPAGTPKEIVERLAAAIGKALENPDVRTALERQAMDVESDSSPEAFAALMKTDLARWQAVVKKANIKVN
ncbi:MAG TPA: tripartite tricarboxylate transporter substrate binding protein [Burkholderiales bacterium]